MGNKNMVREAQKAKDSDRKKGGDKWFDYLDKYVI